MDWKQILCATGLWLLLHGGAEAQPQIAFDKTMHDFGSIRWKVPVTAEFKVRNEGDAPLVINKVSASCGCVVAGWTKQPIPPGGTGYVRSTFDAKAVGRFHKTVGIYCNASPRPVYLAFKGTVEYQPKDYSAYPYAIGSLRLDTLRVDFPDACKGDRPVAEIRIANTSGTPYEPVLMHLPPYLSAEAVPARLEEGEAGVVRLTLNPDQLAGLGLHQTSVYLSRFPGDKVGTDNELWVFSVLLPDFSSLSEAERQNAPKARLSADEDIEMRLEAGKHRVSRKIALANDGNSALEVLALQVSDPAIGISVKKRFVQPRSSATLRVTLNTKELGRRRQPLRVLMITNDPERPKVVFRINVIKE